MNRFPAEKLAEWTGGVWTRPPRTEILRVVHDTRADVAGALYIAIPGARFDGHDFLNAAAELGAAAVMCLRGRGVPDLPCLEVDDPLRALGRLAAGYRRTLGGLVVGVTGSAGKTTVKDLIAEMLLRRGDTCKTPGNWNNQIGLPLSLLAMLPEDDFGVFEVAMNRPGEIAELTAVLQPICGVVTSIGEAHMAAFENVEGIAMEKSSLLAGLPEEGVAVVDLDCQWSDLCRRRTRARIVTCSLRNSADYTCRPAENQQLKMDITDRKRDVTFSVPLPLPGRHMMRNVMLAVAVVREFGLTPDEIRGGLSRFAPAPMRWETRKLGPWTFINDAYNANPLSMRSTLKTFAGMERPVEKWLVLGGMAELGKGERQSHEDLGGFLSEFGFHGLVCVGEKAGWIADKAANTPCYRVDTVAAAAAVLREHAGPGAGILLKASRADRLERILDLMEETDADEGETGR